MWSYTSKKKSYQDTCEFICSQSTHEGKCEFLTLSYSNNAGIQSMSSERWKPWMEHTSCPVASSSVERASSWTVDAQSLRWLWPHLTSLKDFIQIWQVGELQDISILCEMFRRQKVWAEGFIDDVFHSPLPGLWGRARHVTLENTWNAFISPHTGLPTDMIGTGPGRVLVVCNEASAGESWGSHRSEQKQQSLWRKEIWGTTAYVFVFTAVDLTQPGSWIVTRQQTWGILKWRCSDTPRRINLPHCSSPCKPWLPHVCVLFRLLSDSFQINLEQFVCPLPHQGERVLGVSAGARASFCSTTVKHGNRSTPGVLIRGQQVHHH